MKPCREIPFGVREAESAKREALDELAAFGRAFDRQDLRQHWRNRLDLIQLLPQPRQVKDRARGAVETPFARSIEKLKGAFGVIKVAGSQLENGALAEGDDV